MFRIASALALVSIIPVRALGGAWTPEQGSAYHKLAANYYYGDSMFGRTPAGFDEFTNLNLTYYGEYGLLDSLTLYGSLPVARVTRTDFDDEVDNWGVGDVDLGVRYRWLPEPVVVSTAFLVKLPYFYDEDDRLPLGNGQEDFEFRLLLGRSLGSLGYFGVEGAYRYRREDPSDEFRYLIEYGIDVTETLYLRTKLDGIQSLANGDEVSGSPGNPTLANEFDLGKMEFTAGCRFADHWSGELTFTPDLYGRNTLRGYNFQLAVVFAY